MKRNIITGFLIAMTVSCLSYAIVNNPNSVAVAVPPQSGMFNVTVDVDHPPVTVNLATGGTLTFVKQGGGSTQGIQITHFATDGRGELFIKMPGGPIGTVATFRARRAGQGVIQVRLPANKNGRSFYTLNVLVH